MKIKTFVICWLPSFIVVFGLNAIFHTLIASSFFDTQLSAYRPPLNSMTDGNPIWVALFDLILVFAMTYFITRRQGLKISFGEAAFDGGLIGLVASGAFNFINAAMFQHWPLPFIIADIPWHVALGALGGWFIARLYNRFNM